MARAEIVGLYPIEEAESCYLIELLIRDADAQPAFGEFAQPIVGLDRAEWQVPYDEKLLDADGREVLCDLFLDSADEWPSEARVVFFFHELRPDEPLQSPYGEIALPALSLRPSGLDDVEYEAP